MKYLVILFLIFVVNSCQPCLECKYTTLKGVQVETFCSSIKADRDHFRAEQDSLAKKNGSEIVCTAQSY